ncbi:MAG: hypothetical protein JJU42_16700 [Rhodobacteraceae bacterium]|nr:hypothetical protein [Paracoccaceae bacterium]
MDPPDPKDAEIRLLASRRRELVTEQTRRAARLRDLFSGLLPPLERRLDPITRSGLVFLGHQAAPEAPDFGNGDTCVKPFWPCGSARRLAVGLH